MAFIDSRRRRFGWPFSDAASTGRPGPKTASEGAEAVPRSAGPMESTALDRELYYKALRARDARFDGRFLVAVRTTGIYCRPICPARTPKLENVTFYASAAAAQQAGYRPCLR